MKRYGVVLLAFGVLLGWTATAIAAKKDCTPVEAVRTTTASESAEGVLEGGGTGSEEKRESSGMKGSAPNPEQQDQADAEKEASSQKSKDSKAVQPKIQRDRRWVVKAKRSEASAAVRPPKTPKIPFKDESQERLCDEYLKQIRDRFMKARYYSIQGDSCECAEQSKAFLDLIEESRGACPDGYLEKNGYSKRILRNLSWLYELGAKRCVGLTPATQPASDETSAKEESAEGKTRDESVTVAKKEPDEESKTLPQ